jgi:hypothetical protein
MYKLFNANHPMSIIALLLTIFLSRCFIFLNGLHPYSFDTDGLFVNWMINYLGINSILFYLNIILILIPQTVIIYKLTSVHRLLGVYSLLPCFTYVLISSFIPSFTTNIGIQIAVLTLLILLNSFVNIFENKINTIDVYNIGLLLSIGLFFYKPFMVFIFVFLWGLITYRSSIFKDFLLLLLGIATPLYFYFTITIISNKVVDISVFSNTFTLNPFITAAPNVIEIVFFSIIVFAALWGFFKTQSSLFSMLIYNRNIFNIIFQILLIFVVLLFLTKQFSASTSLFCVLPICFMLSFQMKQMRKKWMPELICWSMVIIATVMQFVKI